MSGKAIPSDELHGFDAAAARAVERADSEARDMGHDRVGTEHLLLGLLVNGDETSTRLADAGVTVAAARGKVEEAVGAPRSGRRPTSGGIPRTARATRALGRSLRFAHAAGADLVSSEHLLLGVLDVEGTAGQVLRGLGVEIESLRAGLTEGVDGAPRPARRDAAARTAQGVRCPSCDALLESELNFRVVSAVGEGRHAREAVVFSCGACGRFLGVGSA